MNRKKEYKKYIYWLTKEEDLRLKEELGQKNITIKSARGVVCTPLDEISRIASVTPEVWSGTCHRQGSWYRSSDKNGLYLLVSSFVLESYKEKHVATISRSDFSPPRLASEREKMALIRDGDVVERVPEEWGSIDEKEKRIYIRWAERLGSKSKDFDSLFLTHTANHANFIKPMFFVKEGELIMPYSIDRSAHVCSSCVELYQVLGGAFKKKLVLPCPGATIFARLKKDRYLLVEKPVY